MNEVALNEAATAILAAKAKENRFKTVVARIPSELYTIAMQKQSRMISEAAAQGDTSNISITTVVVEALKAYCGEQDQ
jgi:hypothetical protein